MIFEKVLKSKNKLLLLIILISFFKSSDIYSQIKIGDIKGNVLDIFTRQPLANVLIKIRKTSIIKLSDHRGEFTISDLAVGKYSFEFIKEGYQKLILTDQEVLSGKTTYITAELSTWSVGIEDVFYIGGIEVSAKQDLLPKRVETTTQITSSDIEHIQATSLGDVLDLVPGVEKKNQPSLKKAITAKIRDPRNNDLLSPLSTKVIVDDIPFSNSANLQGPPYKHVYTGMGNGVDLREIPADNIESVEVVRGIAPAVYGDFMGGVINVKTKTFNRLVHRIKGKNNPDTKELNFGGTFPVKKTSVNYNLNWAYSEQDIRKDYDGAQRLAAQLIFKSKLFQNKLSVRNQFKYYGFFENVNENPKDPNAQKSTNKGYRFIFGNKSVYQFDVGSKIASNIYMNYRRLDSYQQSMLQADYRPISTLIENGTMTGIKQYGPYLFRQTTLGDEFSLGQKFTWSRFFFTGKLLHDFIVGNEFIYENNNGKGRSFEIRYPPSPGIRPRSFDDVPGIFQHSIFFNDQISGRLWKDFILNLGLRFERYTSGELQKIKFVESRHGAFLNPRVNLAYYLSTNTQLRFGFGMASKAPSLNHIYPNANYLDVQDVLIDDDGGFVYDSLISTYKFDQSNPKLKGFQEKKLELSLDQRIGKAAASLTGFYSKRFGEPANQVRPFIYHRYYRNNWPDLTGSTIAKTLMSYFQKTINSGWSKFSGLEFTLTSQPIKKLNMDFLINGAYHYVRDKKEMLSPGSIHSNNTIPFYQPHGKWTRQLLFTYQVNYISKALGIWVTLTAQHVPYYQYKVLGGSDSLAVAYYDGMNEKMVYIDEIDRLDEEYERYRLTKMPFHYQTKKYKSKWLLNLSMSKSLFRGAEVSLFVNNFWDDRAIQESPQNPGNFIERNPQIFYGIEFSMIVDKSLQ